MTTLKVAVIMDPIETVNTKKDSTYKMLVEGTQRNYKLFYGKQKDLFSKDGNCLAQLSALSVNPEATSWFSLDEATEMPLAEMDVVLMRKDPPFDMEYIYTTYLLEMAERQGTLIVNKPASLRDANEKLFTHWFPQCCTPSVVTSSTQRLRHFLAEHHDIIVKPLDGMGGASIFRLRQDDPNISVILETITRFETETVMAQRFIPDIKLGDKRILVVDGEPIPYSLARIPAQGETRGNLASGGQGVAQALTERDYWICEQVKQTLKDKGLLFVGLDVIGDYLTEINVTSPTCIQEIEQAYKINIAGQLFDAIEKKLDIQQR